MLRAIAYVLAGGLTVGIIAFVMLMENRPDLEGSFCGGFRRRNPIME